MALLKAWPVGCLSSNPYRFRELEPDDTHASSRDAQRHLVHKRRVHALPGAMGENQRPRRVFRPNNSPSAGMTDALPGRVSGDQIEGGREAG